VADRPNILYFIAHDVGRHLGCYGVPVRTPRLDAFAASGVRFDNVFCNAPACSPSRICAMTGLYAHTSGGVGLAHMGWPLADDVPTIVDYLNEAGYETIHSGMQHERQGPHNHYAVELQTEPGDADAHRGVDKALACLAERHRGRPFYLNIGSQQPHGSTLDRTDELYGGAVPPEQVHVPHYVPDLPSVRRQLGRFQAALRYVDEQFGRLLDGLARLGHDEDTVVIFTTDHGIAMPRAKGTLYDRGVEVALLLRLPGRRMAGAQVHALLQNIDLPPTLLEAAGAEVPERLQGRSCWPLFDARPYTPHEAIFTERNFHGEARVYGRKGDFVDRYDPIRAVRTPAFHYIWRFDPRVKRRPWLPSEVPAGVDELPRPRQPRPEEELYDVQHDPLEFVDLARRPEYADVRRDLRARLIEWMRRTDDFVLRGEVPQRPAEPLYGSVGGVPDVDRDPQA
jgi:arylsulfatase A-like enzyme